MNYEVHKLKTFSFTFSNYCYIILDKATKAAVIVDPAWEFGKIINKLYELDAYLKAIVLTHSHYDHVNLIDPLIAQFNAGVYMSKTEIDYYSFRCKKLYGLNDLDVINIGETKLSCMHTPGHTAGGMCYILPDCIFTGDTVFIEGCGICNSKGGSPELMFESIQRIKAEVQLQARVYPGHSYGKAPGKALEQLMEENIYFLLNNKEHFINFRMRKNQKGIFDFK